MSRLSELYDCGDAHCILRDRSKPSGMRTQGGCQHLKGDQFAQRKLLLAFADAIVDLRAELEACEARESRAPSEPSIDMSGEQRAAHVDNIRRAASVVACSNGDRQDAEKLAEAILVAIEDSTWRKTRGV